MESQIDGVIKALWRFLIPVGYLFVWVLIIKSSRDILGFQLFSNDLFLILTFLILFIGILSRSTTWQIGHEKFGIGGSTLGRFLNFHKDKDGGYWFDAFVDKPENVKELKDLIEKLTGDSGN